MPNREPVVLAADGYKLRHIGPQAAVWPDSPATPVTVLARTDMVARPLPLSHLPSTPDLALGSWTGRLGDAGEQSLTFPNKEASDGIPWRSRFDPTGHLQFIEIYYNGEIESCCVIDQIPAIDQTQVQTHGSDGWFLLKKAYERDWITVQAPRDVIERGTQVWVPTLADGFTDVVVTTDVTTDQTVWLIEGETGFVEAVGGSGVLLSGNGGSTGATIVSPTVDCQASGVWRAQVSFSQVVLTGTGTLRVIVSESSSGSDGTWIMQLAVPSGLTGSLLNSALGGDNPLASTQVTASPSVTLQLESDGQFVWGFVNGALAGCCGRSVATTTSLSLGIEIVSDSSPGELVSSATVASAMVLVQQPFLQRGDDKGDYVLPGDATTYPSGGLHARYFNDLDLQSDDLALEKILAPTRTQAYGGSAPAEYMNQQDPQINLQNPPGFAQTTPGPGDADLSNWSAIWFGAVYLKLSEGDYTFTITGTGSDEPLAMRVWVGQTQFGQQLFDEWGVLSTPASFTVSADTLSGTLPYDGGTVARDGWYPIKVEYAVLGTAATALTLKFTPPASYTDPGGTALTASTSVAIPATSLSPLGMVDQRYQGVSHYDLVQQTAQAYDYQATVEPKQLESGLFPGVLAPRIREGHDTDIILQPDRSRLQDGEGILNYSSGLDATDFASSLQGNGAGFQNGNTGQLQAMVYDAETMMESLFDAQQWTDFSDASFSSLLQASLNAQLGLQLSPWQLLSADPMGRPRQAFSWPLPGALAAMRWRPGDGMRIQAPDINVFDTTPRQMLTFTRNLLPLGIASSQASFALRPKTQARTLKQQLYKATRWARNYQRQLVTLTGGLQTSTLTASETDSGFSAVALLPADQVISARAIITVNTAEPVNIGINGTDQTTSLNGPWSGAPINLDITAFAQPSPNFSLFVQLKNVGAGSTTVQYQLLVTVLR